MTLAIAHQFGPQRASTRVRRIIVVDTTQWAPHPRPRTLPGVCTRDSFVFRADVTTTAPALHQ